LRRLAPAGFNASASGIQVHRLPPRSPNLLAFAERFNLSIKSECLALADIRCRERLGGLLKHYYRRAA